VVPCPWILSIYGRVMPIPAAEENDQRLQILILICFSLPLPWR